MITRAHRGGAGEDDGVGVHYDDPALAAGLARLYDEQTPLGDFYRSRIRRVARILEGVTGALLDAGCGTGQMLRFLGDTRPGDFAITGLDRSTTIIDVASRVVAGDPDIRLVVGRMEEMPFKDASFDVVLAMGSLEYVASIEQTIAEIARVTRPGGLVVVTMQNIWSPYRLWDLMIWSPIQRRRGIRASPIVRRLGSHRLRSQLRASGLAPRSVVGYGFNVLIPPLDTKLPRLSIGVHGLLDRVLRGPLRRIGTDYLVVAERIAA